MGVTGPTGHVPHPSSSPPSAHVQCFGESCVSAGALVTGSDRNLRSDFAADCLRQGSWIEGRGTSFVASNDAYYNLL